MNKHTDRLIDEALALVRGALRRDRIDFKKVTEANLVTTELLERQALVSVSSIETVTSGPASSLAPAERPGPDALPLATARDEQDGSLIVEKMAIAQTIPDAERTGSLNQSTNQSGQETWLDMERANMRNRVAAFKETQQRFQRERQGYCEATMAAARTNEWKPTQS